MRYVRRHEDAFGRVDIGRIGDDEVETAKRWPGSGIQKIRTMPFNFCAVPVRVAPGDIQRFGTDVDANDLQGGEFFYQRDRDAPASASDIEKSLTRNILPPAGFQHPLHQLFGFGPWNENMWIDLELQSEKIGLPENILNGFVPEQSLQIFLKMVQFSIRERLGTIQTAEVETILKKDAGDAGRFALAIKRFQPGYKEPELFNNR